MNKRRDFIITVFMAIIAITFFTECSTGQSPGGITVDMAAQGADVPKSMYGIFFEEINHAGDGGLYAELIQNRHFEDNEMPEGYYVDEKGLRPPKVINHQTGRVNQGVFKWHNQEHPSWSLILNGDAKALMKLTKKNPLVAIAPVSMQIDITKSGSVALQNSGYWGVPVKKGENYKLRFYVRPSTYAGNVAARIISENGNVLAENQLGKVKPGWNEYKAVMTAKETDYKGKFELVFDAAGSLQVEYVSLMPEKTFKGRENGLREDVARFLADLKPAFIRWPGGCIVEGITLNNRVEWKKTIGDPLYRPGQYNVWGYRYSYGFGYDEFLQYCEDIGAKGMYVCNVGIGCQGRSGDACDDKDLQFFIDDCLDAIEYALGDASTVWGKKRIENGHIIPYPLQYVEIGNENGGKLYDKRFDIFYDAIKAKYPQLTLISNHGLGDPNTSSYPRLPNIEKTDMIDPHWYVSPNNFFDNTHIFDRIPRKTYKIYAGEYQTGGNMLAALSEAAFISSMERNSDLVTMASYAPLLQNRNDRTWPVTLIRFDNQKVFGRSSYYVQKMYAENMPSYNLRTELTGNTLVKTQLQEGVVGFGTWDTQAEYKDVVITDSKGKTQVAGSADWNFIQGDWAVENGIVKQAGDRNMTMALWKSSKVGSEYTLEAKARKTGGSEGFFVYFGMSDDATTGYVYNIGGWGNTNTALENVKGGRTAGAQTAFVSQKIDNDQWYDLKLVVNQDKAELFVNDVSIQKYETPPQMLRVYSIAGYDESAGEIVLKLVNAEETPFVAGISLKGSTKVGKKGKIITLYADSLQDENSFEEPTKISPVISEFEGFSNKFKFTFKPRSFTILRIKATKQIVYKINK